MDLHRTTAIAQRLVDAYEERRMLDLVSGTHPNFDMAAAYEVLRHIEADRHARGWRPVGRKIGFTNHTIWERYGVWAPIWARTWDRTVTFAPGGRASLDLAPFVQPRIEPEVVFGLSAPPRPGDDADAVLSCVEWISAGFEIVQCHFADWKFTAPDCTAAFGLHGALVVGAPVYVTESNRARIARVLPAFELALSRDGTVVDRGTGANVLGGPARALAELARTLAGQPQFDPLAAGEVITTGTLTDAWPIAAGQRWESDYGDLGVSGLTVTFA